MHALDVLGDPVRRRILELLADGEVAAGDVGRIVQAEFGITQPAVSQQLRVLRESGFATVRAEGTRRLYAIDPEPIAEAAQWFTPFQRFWRGPLDALGTELARGARARRHTAAASASRSHDDGEAAHAAPSPRDDSAPPAPSERDDSAPPAPSARDDSVPPAPSARDDSARAASPEAEDARAPGRPAAAASGDAGAEASAHPRSRFERPDAPARPHGDQSSPPSEDRTTHTDKEH